MTKEELIKALEELPDDAVILLCPTEEAVYEVQGLMETVVKIYAGDDDPKFAVIQTVDHKHNWMN